MLSKVSNKYGIIMNFIAKKPKAYKVSLFSLFILVLLAVTEVLVIISIRGDSLDKFIYSTFYVLFFGFFGCIACIISFVSGLFIVKSFKHSLSWLIPEGILLLVSTILICLFVFFPYIISSDYKYYYASGRYKANSEDYQGAIKEFDKAIYINPKYAEAFYSRGALKGRLGDYRWAIEDYSKAIEINPEYEEAYLWRGVAKGDLDDFRGAIEDYNKAIEINPKYAAEAYHNRGIAKGELGDDIGAIEDYNKAEEIETNLKDVRARYKRDMDALAYNKSGGLKANLGDYRGEDFNKAIEINPKDARAYNGRGVSKIFLGQKDSGCLDLTKAMELGEPHHAIKQFCNP